MKILYRQPELQNRPADSLLYRCGIRQCYLKQLSAQQDTRTTTRKEHHHTGFELHIIINGCEIYESDGTVYHVQFGELLLIPPLVKHRVYIPSLDTNKNSVSFSVSEDSPLHPGIAVLDRCVLLKTPPEIKEHLRFIQEEHQTNSLFSTILIENRILELLITIFRTCEISEPQASENDPECDIRITIAKQYVTDNLEQTISVPELAHYCHTSTKQLTRLFLQTEGVTPAAYIRAQRIHHIEELLAHSSLSLRQISDHMHFSSEYYFNAFFRHHAGMTPGTYRNMHR